MAGISDFMSIFGDASGAYGDAANSFDAQARKYNDWISRGNTAGQLSLDEFKKLTSNPNFIQNQIAGGWQQSPYQRQLLDQTTRRMNMNAANSGMIQSPVAQNALNNQLNTQTGEFMNDYVNRGMQSYGMGLSGLQDMDKLGLNALDNQGHMISQGIGARLGGTISSNNALNNMLGFGTGIAMNMMAPGAGAAGGAAKAGVPATAGYQGVFGGSGIPYANLATPRNPYSATFNMGGY